MYTVCAIQYLPFMFFLPETWQHFKQLGKVKKLSLGNILQYCFCLKVCAILGHVFPFFKPWQ